MEEDIEWFCLTIGKLDIGLIQKRWNQEWKALPRRLSRMLKAPSLPLPTSKGDYHILEKDMASINGWKQEHTQKRKQKWPHEPDTHHQTDGAQLENWISTWFVKREYTPTGQHTSSCRRFFVQSGQNSLKALVKKKKLLHTAWVLNFISQTICCPTVFSGR